MSLKEIRKEIKQHSDNKKSALLGRFFKTGKGEYAEGDKFLGLNVPTERKLAKKYKNLKLSEVLSLLKSSYHDERQIALFILVDKYRGGNKLEKKKIYELYLANTKSINNWDLVDLSAGYIVGDFLKDKNKNILFKLAKSKKVFERRIAVISTFGYIREGSYKEIFAIAKKLLNDEHDLIHKALGWMLREVGKNCSVSILENFLKANYKIIPRTTLRYAIEKFPEPKRKSYLLGKF